jgi:CysZ protein
MLSSAAAAFAQMLDRKFQGVLWMGVALTFGLFLLLTFALQGAITYLPDFGFSWLTDAIRIISQGLLTVAFIFMGAPVAQMFASIFIDRVADAVEAKHYPGPKPDGASFVELLLAGLSFTAISAVLNLLSIPLQFVSLGIGAVVVVFVNGYLTGRTFFELAALRHMPRREARALRRRHRVRLFLGGVLISFLVMIPILNFFVPLFGAAMMTHEYNKLARSG